ncbi:hypothetical protein J14TS5_47040 [Paenibacillus lautus]|nr:hypothetical protein J14TS5_47040 [Paenibacillus lautus]
MVRCRKPVGRSEQPNREKASLAVMSRGWEMNVTIQRKGHPFTGWSSEKEKEYATGMIKTVGVNYRQSSFLS